MFRTFRGCDDSKVAIWKLTGSDHLRATIAKILKGHDDAIDTLAFSPDGRLLSSLDASGKMIIWCTQVSSLPMNEIFQLLSLLCRTGGGFSLRKLLNRPVSMNFVGTKLVPSWPYRTKVKT
jgi:WD40 repeat protein